MGFLRARVAPVQSKPPPGSYATASLTVHFHTDTPNSKILYTDDGTEPQDNSDRDHGFRCHHYLPHRGCELVGGGKHVLTVVAISPGMVQTRPQQFTFVLAGPRAAERCLRGQDHILDETFNRIQHAAEASASRHGGRSGGVAVLRDVCPKSRLQAQVDSGTSVRMYKLKYRAGQVSRSILFERVATPALHMTMPTIPGTPSSGPAESLSFSFHRCLTPSTYEAPLLLDRPAVTSMQVAGTTGDSAALQTVDGHTSHPRSRGSGGLQQRSSHGALTTVPDPLPAAVALSTRSRSVTPSAVLHVPFDTTLRSLHIDDDERGAVFPRLRVDAHPERVVHLKRVSTDIALFELRNGTAQLRVTDGVQEAADKAEEDQYVAACERAVREEVTRKERVSRLFPLLALDRPPALVHHDDVAARDKEALSLFLIGEELAKTATLHALVSSVPFSEAYQKLYGHLSMNGPELCHVLGNVVTPQQVQRDLKPLAIRSEGTWKYPCKHLLNVWRYLVCLSAPLPEAPLHYFFQIWRSLGDAKGEGSVGKLSFLTAMDVYRKTRGASALVVAQLQDVYYNRLEWSRDATASLVAWQACMAEFVPAVDASFALMNQVDLPLYKGLVKLS